MLRFFLDEGVPDSVGHALSDMGHRVFYLRDVAVTGSPDPLVCAVAEANDAILVGSDGDLKQLAKRHGVGQRRFRKLSLIKLSCNEARASSRIISALSLIEHEWQLSFSSKDRRIFIEIGDASISTRR